MGWDDGMEWNWMMGMENAPAFALSKMELLHLSAIPFASGKYPTVSSGLI